MGTTWFRKDLGLLPPSKGFVVHVFETLPPHIIVIFSYNCNLFHSLSLCKHDNCTGNHLYGHYSAKINTHNHRVIVNNKKNKNDYDVVANMSYGVASFLRWYNSICNLKTTITWIRRPPIFLKVNTLNERRQINMHLYLPHPSSWFLLIGFKYHPNTNYNWVDHMW